jgi:hypothetical protein
MTLNTDLPESERDKKELEQEETIIDLPDIKDIPGQENIHVPGLGELADTTISSDDEEGIGIFDEDDTDLTGERLGPAEEIDENDLIIGDDEELEAALDEEENTPDGEDDIDVTDESVSEDSDVSEDEKISLERTANDMDTPDNEDLYAAELDDTDFDGEKLNEDIEVTADDLDIPGAELDDEDEEIGEEDEENNDYSEADTK